MIAVCAGWYAVVQTSHLAHPSAAVHDAALVVHLASLAVGFGAVLTIDAAGLAVLTGRLGLGRLLDLTVRAERLIWAGFLGLAVSGAALRPNFGNGWTLVNLFAVLAVALNGIFAHTLRSSVPPAARTWHWRDLPASLRWRAAAAAAVSQAAWWTSILIGALTS